MTRYIDADAFWKELTTRIEDYCEIEDLMGIIESQPAADVVEVVRCKECEYGTPIREDGTVKYDCRLFGHWDLDGDFYCADGERRE